MSIAIGYVHDTNGPSHSWYVSMWASKNYDAKHGRLIRCELATHLSKVDGLGAARNQVVREFLEDTEYEWLLMVDRDMGWPPDAVHRLLSAADPAERPIVGGLCFAAWATEPDGMGGWRIEPVPTIYRRNETGFGLVELYPADMVIRVDATGAAFLLIHRSVLQKIESDWFTPLVKDGKTQYGEDFSFCVRAGEAGFPIHVHTGVKTTHHKEIWLGEADYWRDYEPPPARERTAVVVPDTDEIGEEFFASLEASTSLAVVDSSDSTRPWLFFVPADVRFGPGWLDHAQHVGNTFKASVVKAGVGLLVRREFVDEHGTDPEALIEAARERGVFQKALGAVVELPEATDG